MNNTKKKLLSGRNIFYITAVAWPIIQFLVFYLYVNFNSILLAVQEFNYSEGGTSTFVGLANFRQVIEDFIELPEMMQALKNTITVFLLSMVFIFLQIILAYYLFKKYPIKAEQKI